MVQGLHMEGYAARLNAGGGSINKGQSRPTKEGITRRQGQQGEGHSRSSACGTDLQVSSVMLRMVPPINRPLDHVQLQPQMVHPSPEYHITDSPLETFVALQVFHSSVNCPTTRVNYKVL